MVPVPAWTAGGRGGSGAAGQHGLRRRSERVRAAGGAPVLSVLGLVSYSTLLWLRLVGLGPTLWFEPPGLSGRLLFLRVGREVLGDRRSAGDRL